MSEPETGDDRRAVVERSYLEAVAAAFAADLTLPPARPVSAGLIQWSREDGAAAHPGLLAWPPDEGCVPP